MPQEQVTLLLYCSLYTCNSGTVLGTTTADASGSFSVSVPIPATALLGTQDIGARGSAGSLARRSFTGARPRHGGGLGLRHCRPGRRRVQRAGGAERGDCGRRSLFHSLALRYDGTVVAWGCGNGYDFGQCSVPVGLSGVTAITGGEYHSLALRSDGTVVAWGCSGASNYGQCSVPAGLSGVTAIAAGTGHSLALKRDGTVVAWGCNSYNYGQCSVPAGLSGVTAISASEDGSLALKSDGTVVAWGCGAPYVRPVQRAGRAQRGDRHRGRPLP